MSPHLIPYLTFLSFAFSLIMQEEKHNKNILKEYLPSSSVILEMLGHSEVRRIQDHTLKTGTECMCGKRGWAAAVPPSSPFAWRDRNQKQNKTKAWRKSIRLPSRLAFSQVDLGAQCRRSRPFSRVCECLFSGLFWKLGYNINVSSVSTTRRLDSRKSPFDFFCPRSSSGFLFLPLPCPQGHCLDVGLQIFFRRLFVLEELFMIKQQVPAQKNAQGFARTTR